MCLGEVISKLMEARYSSIEEVVADIDLIVTNCETYYRGMHPDKLPALEVELFAIMITIIIYHYYLLAIIIIINNNIIIIIIIIIHMA